MACFRVVAHQFAKLNRAMLILAALTSAAPYVLQGQCQPLRDSSKAQASEPQSSSTVKKMPGTPEFYDEPKFTVAGVIDTTDLGGHGSAAAQRNTEALTKDTVLLKKESSGVSQPGSIDAAREKSLRASLDRDPGNAALHHSLADTEEKLGNPLEAVREYQRAAELDPSEPNLFDWGTELLLHHAPQAAMEVFAKGNRMYPGSSRTLIALAVAWRAQGANDRALQCLFEASDLNPSDASPYLFLGKMQNSEIVHSRGYLEKMERFVQLQPENPLANYYYATTLWNRANHSPNAQTAAQVESLLNKAVRLDSKLGVAYLQLGILYAAREELLKAIAAYQRASDLSPELEEPHYRLADAYRRVGEKARAEHELQLYKELSKKNSEQAERERHEIQQFVFALRDQPPATPAPQPQHQ